MLHVATPIRRWIEKSNLCNANVLLKLENLQPCSSFKIRGLGYCIQEAIRNDGNLKTIVSSSGGNAGLAATIAATALGLQIVVFVPKTTPESTRNILEKNGAIVFVKGDVWDETHLEALKYMETVPNCFYVHPFEHPDIWKGHATIIQEISKKLPDVIIVSVGGGGLLCGVLRGLIDANLEKKPLVVAVETEGAASFHEAVKHSQPTELDAITSIAKSLGAKKVTPETLRLRQEYGADFVQSVVVSDKQALGGVIEFCNEFRMLVEPACGAALSIVNENIIDMKGLDVMVVVCGGFGVTLELIDQWKSIVGYK